MVFNTVFIFYFMDQVHEIKYKNSVVLCLKMRNNIVNEFNKNN